MTFFLSIATESMKGNIELLFNARLDIDPSWTADYPKDKKKEKRLGLREEAVAAAGAAAACLKNLEEALKGIRLRDNSMAQPHGHSPFLDDWVKEPFLEHADVFMVHIQ